MASIDKIMALSNEIKKKKKLDQTTISMTNINDLAKEIKSGNKNAVNDYLSKSTGINLNKNGGNTNNFKKAQTKKSAINKEQLMNEASSNYPLMFGKKQADEDGKKWYQKILQVPEAFDDGYQFGDVTKTIGGSVVDLGLSAVKGFVSVPEQGADLFTGLLAQGADLIGKDDFADNLRTSIANQEGHIFSKAINKIQEPVDDYSILGETTDVGGEGIGQAFAYYTIGKLGGATKGATLTGKNLTVAEKAAQVAKATKTTRDVAIFSSAAGGTLSESYQKEDVEDWQVWLKAIGTGILAKKIEEAGGIFSKGGADKVATNAMTGDMKSSFAKVATRFLGTGIAEGGEEGIEYVAGKVLDIGIDTANSITSENDATFFDGWDWDEFWTSIFAGTMSGTSMGAGQTTIETVNNKFSNPNMTWGEALDLTDKNQANRDQIEIAENKKAKLENKLKSKNLTQTEIDKIFTEMQQIDEQIKALKGQSNIAPVDNTAQIEGLQTAIEEKTQELERSQDAREKQIIQEQINNLQEELNDATNAQTFTDESNLKQQAFVYEANENDGEFAKGVYESASKLMNNTKEAHTLVDVVAKIAEDRGTNYEFTNNKALKEAGHKVGDNTINGLVVDGEKVLINLDSNKSLTAVLGHETTHLLEGTAEYEALKKVVIEYAQQKGIYKDTYDRISNLYQGTNANIDNEITSDLVGELLFTDQSFVENLSVQQPNVFQKIYNYIKHVYKMATAGSQEAKQLEKIKYQFDQAWKKQGKTIKEGVKYSKGEATDNQGRTLTKEQQEYFKDSKARDENGNLEVVYHGTNSEFNIFKKGKKGYLGAGIYLTDERNIAERYTDYGIVKEVYVDIKNPLTVDSDFPDKQILRAIYGNDNVYNRRVAKQSLATFIVQNSDLKKLQEMGYDGIIWKHPSGNEYMVFNSNQIKNIDNTNPTSDPDIRYSLSEDTDIDTKINSSMTMAEAKDMIQRAFMLNNIYNWYDGEYKNGDEWLSGQGADDIAMYIENTYQLQEKYLNKIYEKDIGFGDDFLLESIVEAYQNGTLIGSEKQTAQRLDVSKEIDYQDNRFYAPQEIQIGKELYEVANQRVTNANRQEVYKARANFIIAAHNKGFAEAMGLTQEEVSKKLKSWANYTKKAMDLSNSLNEGVASQNRWSGIENSSIVNTISVSNEEMGKMVKEIKGDSSGWQRQYITSTMLALDTHIDYSNLTFEFEAGQKMSENAAGQYFQDEETIRISHAGQNTVAHEIGHYLDHKWAEDLGYAGKSLTDKYLKTDHLNAEQKQFVENFKLFVEDIENSSYLGSEYSQKNDYWQRSNEVFARFVGKFTEWVKNQATNNRYGYEDKWYKDNFTERQYREFVKILQEKSMLDATYKKFKDDLLAKVNIVKGKHSLSSQNEEIAPTGDFNIYGKDVKLQVEEAIAPLQEKIESLTEQIETVVDSMEQLQAPVQEVQPTQPTLEEVQNLMDIRDNKSGSEYARAFYALRDKYGQVELYKSLNEYYSTGTVTQPSNVENIDLAPVSQEVVEKQGQEAFEHITDEQAPSFEDIADEAMWNETFESEPESKVQSPFDERDIDEVGNRKVKAYQYENPEVRPFFQAEAQNMIYDLDNTIKGEKGVAIDELGNYEYYGITRQTTEAIAYLKDNYGYSYDQIRKGLNDIIEDNGKENNAVAKRIEFMLDERLREGYTTSDGIPIPANQEYINFLNERQITEYNKEAFNALTEQDMPLNITPEPRETSTINQNAQTQQTIPMKRITAQNENTDVLEGKQRKWVKTSTESEVVNREILPDDLDQKKIMYQPISNKSTLGKANARLDTLGYEKSIEYFNNQILNNKVTVEDIAMGERLIQEALRQGDKKTAGDLIQNVAILGTELGQKVQALSIIQRMTPEGQLKMLEKTINRGKVKGDKAFTDVNLTDDMRQKILDTYNDDGSYNKEALDKAVEDVKQDIADQMKVTAMDKINAWRYLSMLGNPKTHIRNLVSNVAMKGTVAVKNAVARTIETVAPIENRTRTWKPASQTVSDFAKQTAVEMKDIISGDSKYNETADIKAKREIFKNKVLNKLSNLNSNILEKEDWWFSKGAFENSFKEFLTANGITTQEDIQNNPEIIEKGKLYATEQAQIATFRQYSWLANKIGEMERKNAATQIAVGSIVPFKKTPINIAKTGLSYSPLGFAKTLTYDMAQVKKGNMEASTLIDHIAQNTVGSALTLVGYMLAKAGILNGAGDDDKEGQYDYQLGKQAYSLNIGGNTYSLSWLTPVAMPMMVGANAYEQLEEGQEWNGDVVLETLAQTLDPLSEMSFLSSLDSVLSSYDSGIQKFAGIGESMLQNYLTQFIPTASSQLAATLDDTKRTTKVSGDSSMKIVDETYNKLIYKVPFLRETLEPTTDIWGNEVKQSENLFTRVFENFIAPYSRKESIATEIDEELKDLYSQTGDNGILPSIPYNYVNYDGEKYNMSAEEYTEYKKTYGQTANDLLEDLFRTTTYQRATAEERTEMVNKVYDYARDEAKLEYLEKEGVDYTNATEDGKDVYKENLIKGAIENDMALDEYKMYIEDPEEFSFLKEKGYSYRRKYFKTYESLKEIDESFEDQKEGVNDDDELDVLYSEKKTNIINSIINSGLEDTEKASLYKKYYNTDTVDTIVKSAISIDDYLTYETKEFKADKNAKGNSIPGSRKDKVIDYVNTLDMTIAQKAILIKSTNTFKFNDYNNDIVNYVIDLDLTYEEKKAILEDLDMTIDEEGYVWWD